MSGYDYTNLPYCADCPYPDNLEEKTECALHWRPETGTKTGFPTEDGWNCPKDGLLLFISKEGLERFERIIKYVRKKLK